MQSDKTLRRGRRSRPKQPGQAEIKKLYLLLRGDHDVSWCQIAVHNAMFVGILQGLRYLFTQREYLLLR